MEQVLKLCTRDGRVCPLGGNWAGVDRVLKRAASESADPGPPPSFILGGWWMFSDEEKAERLRGQVHYAAEHGLLEPLAAYLSGLKDDQWHYYSP